MAASGSIPEQGRPPEAVNDNEITDVNCNVEHVRLLKEGACPKIISKSESCKETLRKVFFSKKSPVKKSDDAIKTVSASIDATPKCKKAESASEEVPVRAKNRNSFHQDVEEALSSLLWQPYEYQNKGTTDYNSDNYDYQNIGSLNFKTVSYEYHNKDSCNSKTNGLEYQNKSDYSNYCEYQKKNGLNSYKNYDTHLYQKEIGSNEYQDKSSVSSSAYQNKSKLEYPNKGGLNKNSSSTYGLQNKYGYKNNSGLSAYEYQNKNSTSTYEYPNKSTCEYQYNNNSCTYKNDASTEHKNDTKLYEYQNRNGASTCAHTSKNDLSTCEYQNKNVKSACEYQCKNNTSLCEHQNKNAVSTCEYKKENGLSAYEYQNKNGTSGYEYQNTNCISTLEYQNQNGTFANKNKVKNAVSTFEAQNKKVGSTCNIQYEHQYKNKSDTNENKNTTNTSNDSEDLQNIQSLGNINSFCEYSSNCSNLSKYQNSTRTCVSNLTNFNTNAQNGTLHDQNNFSAWEYQIKARLKSSQSEGELNICDNQDKSDGMNCDVQNKSTFFEYKNKSNSCSIDYGSTSSSCSSSLEDLNNGKERSTGNAADLHLLVNNLRVNLLSQSASPVRCSRDGERWCSDVCVPSLLGAVSPVEECAGAGGRCDEKGPMRVEIQQQAGSANAVRSENVSVVGASQTLIMNQNQNRNSVLSRNLSSVNVVGLPSSNHPRQASVPSSTNNAGRGLLIPNHSRNTSEPFRSTSANNNVQFNHPRNGSEPVVPPFRPAPNTNTVSILNQQRYVGNANSAIHLRSSSVPYQQQQPQLNLSLRNPPEVNTRVNRTPLNVSNVNVNYYRAVPVNVVSAVPTIQCFNSTTNSSDANNVSNVNIVQAMPVGTAQTLSVPTSQFSTQTLNHPFPNLNLLPTLSNATTSTSTCTEVIVHSSHDPVQQVPEVRTRTFTSTEAQTDETLNPESGNSTTREQRRRERRERRHQRRLNNANHNHRHATNTNSSRVENGTNTNTIENSTQINSTQTERLPDLLNNTLPPPYTTGGVQGTMVQPPPPPPPLVQGNLMVPPGTIVQSMVPNNIVPTGLIPFHPQIVPVQGAGPVPVPVPSPTGFRFPFPASGFRRSRYSEEPPKSCCGLLAWRPGSLRWFIALIALVAVCCVLVGTALGAMRPSGRDHLTVSLLMIGVGIILVTVSGVAWRLTSHDSSTCRSMLGLGSTESVEVCPRRFVPRLPPSYGRPHHPYAAMMYPEFQYRPPPPSYQASMQEYRLRLLLLDRGNTPQIQAGIQNAVSPPPTYRSHSGSLLRAPLSNRRDLSQSEYSCPPSYRSQTSSSRPATIMQNNSIIHSREQSLSLSESNNGGSVVNVVNILTTNDEDIALDNITLDSLKLEPDQEINPLKLSPKIDLETEGNLVTIVQTDDRNPVIVTVSGSSQSDNCNQVQITEIPSEMEILAHL